MVRISLPSGCDVEEPAGHLLRFCREEYDYYDAISSTDPNRIEPIDVLVTVAVNSYLNNASAIRRVRRGMADTCPPFLLQIPENADLLTFDPQLELVGGLFHAAIQSPGVLIPVATKVLHRKRRFLIPMLDYVVIGHYLKAAPQRLPAKTQDKARAAATAIEVLAAFRDDLRAARSEIDDLRGTLEAEGYKLSPVRILELLVWTQTEGRGYYL